MAKKESAEQKLLKIIEATKKSQGASAHVEVSPVVRKSGGRFMVSVQQFNYLLMVAVLTSLIYLGYEVRNGMQLLQQDFNISAEVSNFRGAADLIVPQVKSLSYYLDQISSRNIFRPYEKMTVGSQGTETARAALEKKLQKYRLVGVAWLDVPESATVMIEDTSNGVTRFLKEGEKLEDVTIKTIYTDRMVVGYENEEIVIKL